MYFHNSLSIKTELDSSIAKADKNADDEVSQLMSHKSEMNSSGSDERNSYDTTASSSGLSSPVSLDFELNPDESMVTGQFFSFIHKDMEDGLNLF